MRAALGSILVAVAVSALLVSSFPVAGRSQNELLTAVGQLGGSNQASYLASFPTVAVIKTNLEARLQVPNMPLADQQQLDALLVLASNHAQAWTNLQGIGQGAGHDQLVGLQGVLAAAKALKSELQTSTAEPDTVDLLLLATLDLLRSTGDMARSAAQSTVSVPTADRLAFFQVAIEGYQEAGQGSNAAAMQREFDGMSRTYTADMEAADNAIRAAETARDEPIAWFVPLISQYGGMRAAVSDLQASGAKLQAHGETQRSAQAQQDLTGLQAHLAQAQRQLLQSLAVYLAISLVVCAWGTRATYRWQSDVRTASLGSGIPGT
ncbi:MAG: hypothetical protein V4510_05620 [bacterium]